MAVGFKTIEVYDEDDKVVEQPDEFEWQWAFESIMEDLTEYAPTLWPSLNKCDVWVGDEDHAVLENDLAYIGISEYCGLVAVWVLPKTGEYENSGWGDDPRINLCDRWCTQITDKFLKTFSQFNSYGRMSNGEEVFRRIEQGAVG